MAPVLRDEDEKNETIPKMLCQMDNHLACVNCVRWSNNGLYLASGGDDKLIMVWKRAAYIGPSTVFGSSSKLANVEQWRCVTILRSHTGDVMDVAWSPHDAWLASCSVDNTIVIWNARKFPVYTPTNMDFVGHRKAVTVVKFNPKIFKKKQKNGSSPKPSCPYCCCAVGSKDRSVSVWLTCLKRPLVVIHELFDKSIMDISWTLNGLGILVCSMDGTVAYLDFSQDELGDPLNEEEKNSIHQKIYGKSLAITTEAQLPTTIIENPEMLKYQQQKQLAEQRNAASREAHMPKLTSVVNGESLEDIRKNLLKKQVETRTADGRRRITPLCIAQLDTGDFSPALFNSVPILPGSSVSSQLTQQLTSSDSNTANSLSLKPCPEPTAAAASRPADDALHKEGVNATATMLSAVVNSIAGKPNSLTSAAKIEPMKALDSRFTERSKATPGVAISSLVSLTLLDRFYCELVEKEGKAEERYQSTAGERSRAADKDPPRVVVPMAVLKLPTPAPQKAFTVQISSDPSVFIEVENEISPAGGSRLSRLKCNREGKVWETVLTSRVLTAAGSSSDPSVFIEVENEISTAGGSRLSRLKCNREGKVWETVLTSRVLTAAGSSDVIGVACEDRTLSVFSVCGRRLLPAILLQAPMSTLHCSGCYVMALTACATLSVCTILAVKTAMAANANLVSSTLQCELSGVFHTTTVPTTDKDPPRVVVPMAVLKLPTPAPQKAFTVQISSDPSVFIEVENEISTAGGSRLSRLKCNREGKVWETVLTSRVLTAAGSSDVIGVACEDRTLSVFSACGRRLLPAILLQAPMSTLHCSGCYVMALTACATLSVWDVQKQSVLVKNESLQIILSGTDTTVSQSLLTQHGVPVVSLASGKSYCFNSSLGTWNLIADKQDSLVQCADYRNCFPSQEAMLSSGPLAIVQGHTLNAGRQASRLSSTPHLLQQGMTLAYLENQMASALALKSSPEYRHWLLIYARFLVNEVQYNSSSHHQY
ncbi:UNVERIFIED_CONTAM: hypothetical protein FKN15_034721 [Acipenser sinensis]